MYQFIVSSLMLLALIVGAWINFNIKVADLNARVVNLEQSNQKLEINQRRKIDKTDYLEYTHELNQRLMKIEQGQTKIYQLLIERK